MPSNQHDQPSSVSWSDGEWHTATSKALGRTQQPSGDLAPGFRAGIVDQPDSPSMEFGGCHGDVSDLELDTGLRSRDFGGLELVSRNLLPFMEQWWSTAGSYGGVAICSLSSWS